MFIFEIDDDNELSFVRCLLYFRQSVSCQVLISVVVVVVVAVALVVVMIRISLFLIKDDLKMMIISDVNPRKQLRCK